MRMYEHVYGKEGKLFFTKTSNFPWYALDDLFEIHFNYKTEYLNESLMTASSELAESALFQQ